MILICVELFCQKIARWVLRAYLNAMLGIKLRFESNAGEHMRAQLTVHASPANEALARWITSFLNPVCIS
jgi:hypothetical protein